MPNNPAMAPSVLMHGANTAGCPVPFYELNQLGKAPRSYYVGTRRFISAESDLAWLLDREAEQENSVA